MERTGHSDVGQESCPAGKNGLIGRGDVGVGSDHSGYTAIEVPTHRNLLRRGFPVHVDENDFDVVRNFRQFRVRGSKWVVRGRPKDMGLVICEWGPCSWLFF